MINAPIFIIFATLVIGIGVYLYMYALYPKKTSWIDEFIIRMRKWGYAVSEPLPSNDVPLDLSELDYSQKEPMKLDDELLNTALVAPEIPEQVFDLFPRDDKKYLKISVRVVARALGYGGRHRSGWVRNQVIAGLRRWGYKVKIDKRNPRLLLIQAK